MNGNGRDRGEKCTARRYDPAREEQDAEEHEPQYRGAVAERSKEVAHLKPIAKAVTHFIDIIHPNLIGRGRKAAGAIIGGSARTRGFRGIPGQGGRTAG